MSQTSFHLKVEQGPTRGKKYTVSNEALVIGSGPEVEILIEAPGVAERHARIRFEAGQVRLEDLGTQEGTFRNGQRLLGPAQVFPGDRIGLGPEVVLILEGQGPEAETDPEMGDLGLAPDELI